MHDGRLLRDEHAANDLRNYTTLRDANRKRVAAAALIRDTRGRVCLVKGNYRPDWHLPGGTVEAEESPAAGCERELREELGLDLSVGRLLCLEWVHEEQDPHGGLQLVYAGGILDSEVQARIVLAAEELTGHRFVTMSEAAPLVNARNLRRLTAALQCVDAGGLAELDRISNSPA